MIQQQRLSDTHLTLNDKYCCFISTNFSGMLIIGWLVNPFITDKKKVKGVSTLGDISRQQAVKLGLSV